jgi:hypothetical protein
MAIAGEVENREQLSATGRIERGFEDGQAIFRDRNQMTRRKTTIVVTIEQRQRMTVRRGHRSIDGWCDECSAEALLLSPDEAAAVLQTNAREIFRQVEAGTVHFVESIDGSLRVCVNSLTRDYE